MSPTNDSPRGDRSATIRAAILESARRLFVERGFDATGVRDIAAEAGVNPAIVIRHYGSKERLFLEAMESEALLAALLAGPMEGLGERVVRVIMQERRGGGQRILAELIRASGRDATKEHLRRIIEDSFVGPLVDRIDRPGADLRARLVAAQLVGLMTALAVYDDDVLLAADGEAITVQYGSGVQAMLDG